VQMWTAAKRSLLTAAVDTDLMIVWPWRSLTGWRIAQQKGEKSKFCWISKPKQRTQQLYDYQKGKKGMRQNCTG